MFKHISKFILKNYFEVKYYPQIISYLIDYIKTCKKRDNDKNLFLHDVIYEQAFILWYKIYKFKNLNSKTSHA